MLNGDKPMEQHYLLLKSLHIFGVIIFLGNIIVTAFWKTLADRSKDWRIIAFSQRLVTYTDIFFTAVGVITILVTGLLLAKHYGQYWNIKWISWGLCLFIASGLTWLFILIPVQIILHSIANQFSDTSIIPKQYWFYERIWIFFGIIATVLPLMNLYWMVYKPN